MAGGIKEMAERIRQGMPEEPVNLKSASPHLTEEQLEALRDILGISQTDLVRQGYHFVNIKKPNQN
jgi:hypothetical protein